MPIKGPTTNHEEIRRWAQEHKALPVELLPSRVDHEPAEIRIVPAAQVTSSDRVRRISWEDFFARFEAHGLTFVYDDDSSGYNEVLQIEEKSPYRSPRLSAVPTSN